MAVLSQITMTVAHLSNNLGIPKDLNRCNNPFSRLKTIMDFHFDASKEMLEKLDSVNMNILMSMRPLAEAINGINLNKAEKDALFFKAISDAIESSKLADSLQNELLPFIKDKNKSLRILSNFPDLFSWGMIKISSLLVKIRGSQIDIKD